MSLRFSSDPAHIPTLEDVLFLLRLNQTPSSPRLTVEHPEYLANALIVAAHAAQDVLFLIYDNEEDLKRHAARHLLAQCRINACSSCHPVLNEAAQLCADEDETPPLPTCRRCQTSVLLVA